jgi:hypothetical protein
VVGVGVAVGVEVTVPVGVTVLACSDLVVEGMPPPTPPLPDRRLVAVEDAGVSAAAHAQLETKTTATIAQPAMEVTRRDELSSGALERIPQLLETSNPTRRTASPKNMSPGLPLRPASIQKAIKK